MSTPKLVPPTNGTKPAATEAPKISVATTTVKKIEPAADQDLPPLEERLLRINQLFEVQSKYNRLLASKQKLSEFTVAQKSENVSLSIEDNSNRSHDFETRNPELIAEVLECVRQTIDKKIKAIEPLLKW